MTHDLLMLCVCFGTAAPGNNDPPSTRCAMRALLARTTEGSAATRRPPVRRKTADDRRRRAPAMCRATIIGERPRSPVDCSVLRLRLRAAANSVVALGQRQKLRGTERGRAR